MVAVKEVLEASMFADSSFMLVSGKEPVLTKGADHHVLDLQSMLKCSSLAVDSNDGSSIQSVF
jgi:hypothetical protein